MARALATALTFAAALAGCGVDPALKAQQAQAQAIAGSLMVACPLTDADDLAAFDSCSAALGKSELLRDAMNEPFLWGQQSRLWEYDPVNFKMTRFNPLVWRRLYLSLFMFSSYTLEQSGELTIARLAVDFRNGLDAGDYPYPFWHAPSKWRDYQLAQELLLVFKNGRIIGALRSAVRLTARPHTERRWDGAWTWDAGAEPHASLYRHLFKPDNPHLDRLETAYRDLEFAMRPYACGSCHQPDNNYAANPLELLTYPNQALVARHDLVYQIEAKLMPPFLGTGKQGIEDATKRAELGVIAREFEAAADAALAAEGEPTSR